MQVLRHFGLSVTAGPLSAIAGMKDLSTAAALVVSVLTFALLYGTFFGAKKDFWECVRYSLTPNFLSWLANDLQRDYGKSLKLGLFLAIVIGAGYVAHELVRVFA